MGRTIVVGDIHGCFDELLDLIEVLKLKSDDRLIAVGDLITKGPKNREVLDLFISDRRFSSVVANHDRSRITSCRACRSAPWRASRATNGERHDRDSHYGRGPA